MQLHCISTSLALAPLARHWPLRLKRGTTNLDADGYPSLLVCPNMDHPDQDEQRSRSGSGRSSDDCPSEGSLGDPQPADPEQRYHPDIPAAEWRYIRRQICRQAFLEKLSADLRAKGQSGAQLGGNTRSAKRDLLVADPECCVKKMAPYYAPRERHTLERLFLAWQALFSTSMGANDYYHDYMWERLSEDRFNRQLLDRFTLVYRRIREIDMDHGVPLERAVQETISKADGVRKLQIIYRLLDGYCPQCLMRLTS